MAKIGQTMVALLDLWRFFGHKIHKCSTSDFLHFCAMSYKKLRNTYAKIEIPSMYINC